MISVLIPTYKRLECLKRAVDQIMAQTYTDWELVISDDEVGEDCETWRWLLEIASKDNRIRPVKNCGVKHGQVYNLNNGFRATKGEWVKVLFDDDGMLPNCLERFAEVAKICPRAALIGCRAQTWRNGSYIADEKNFQRHCVEMIPQKDCLRAMCMLDRWNGTTPTHMMARGDLVRNGYGMIEDDKYKMVVDIRWFAHILTQGDYVMMSDVLVQQRQGEVESLTAECMRNMSILDEEDPRLYLDIYDNATRDESWPSRLSIATQMNIVKAMFYLMHRQYSLAGKRIIRSFVSARGIQLAARFFSQKLFPNRFSATKRGVVV